MAPKQSQKWLEKAGKTGLRFLLWLRGVAEVWVPRHMPGLVWLVLPFRAKGGSNWASIAACPDEGQKGKEDWLSLKAVIKHQIWSQTITQTHVTFYKKCIKRELANEDEIAAKKGKMVTLEMKCELNINGVTEETADGSVGGWALPPLKKLYICTRGTCWRGTHQ